MTQTMTEYDMAAMILFTVLEVSPNDFEEGIANRPGLL